MGIWVYGYYDIGIWVIIWVCGYVGMGRGSFPGPPDDKGISESGQFKKVATWDVPPYANSPSSGLE